MTLCATFSCLLSGRTEIFFLLFSMHLFHCIISPRLASKHGRADRCIASFMDKISYGGSILFSLYDIPSVSLSAPILALFSHLFPFSLILALQTWAVHSQRARRCTRGGSLGSLESFWYLFTDVRRGHQDCCARMQPTCVSSPTLCSHACLVDLVSI